MVSSFLGGSAMSIRNFFRNLRYRQRVLSKKNNINSRDIKMHYLTEKFNKKVTNENFNELQKEMKQIKFFEEKFEQIKTAFNLSG